METYDNVSTFFRCFNEFLKSKVFNDELNIDYIEI